jgi:exosome complex exonuclease RRP6
MQTKSKVDKIKSSVVLPFHHFSGGAKPQATTLPVAKSVHPEPEIICNDPASQMEEVIQLDTGTDDHNFPENNNADGQRQCEPEGTELSSPPSELSSGIEQHFQSLNEGRNLQQNQKAPEEPEFNDQLKAFDYAEARKNISFGEVRADRRKDNAVARAINKESGDKRRTAKQPGDEEDEGNFQNPRRRQAFPPSGNRSSTYH